MPDTPDFRFASDVVKEEYYRLMKLPGVFEIRDRANFRRYKDWFDCFVAEDRL